MLQRGDETCDERGPVCPRNCRMFPGHEESTDYRHVSLATILEKIRKGTYRALFPSQGPSYKGPLAEGGGDPHTVIRHSTRRRRNWGFHEEKIFVEGGTISLHRFVILILPCEREPIMINFSSSWFLFFFFFSFSTKLTAL